MFVECITYIFIIVQYIHKAFVNKILTKNLKNIYNFYDLDLSIKYFAINLLFGNFFFLFKKFVRYLNCINIEKHLIKLFNIFDIEYSTFIHVVNLKT